VILTDEREYIAMLSEALDAQRIQFSDAKARQEEEVSDFQLQVSQAEQAMLKSLTHLDNPASVYHAIAARLKDQVDARRSRLQLVETSLANQARHIDFLDGFLRTAANASAQARLASYKAGEGGGGGGGGTDDTYDDGMVDDDSDDNDGGRVDEFTPAYEWQVIRPNQQIPAGLDISVNISAGFGGTAHDGNRRARIPPVWRLKLWVEWHETLIEEIGDGPPHPLRLPAGSHNASTRVNRYHRQDVKRDDTTGAIEMAIARAEKVDPKYVKLLVYHPKTKQEFHLGSSTTFEPYLFIHQRDLRVVIGSPDELYPEVVFQANVPYATSEAGDDEEEDALNGGLGKYFSLVSSEEGEAAAP
jgi:hypothetical protein